MSVFAFASRRALPSLGAKLLAPKVVGCRALCLRVGGTANQHFRHRSAVSSFFPLPIPRFLTQESGTGSSTPQTSSTHKGEDLPPKSDVPHFHHPPPDSLATREVDNERSHMPHPVWSAEDLNSVSITHLAPKTITDKAAHYTVQAVRLLYDLLTGYTFGTRDEACYVRRIIFLETIAGVPGMVGAMIRHLNSLRRMQRDYGWIHTLLEEAENERMHLMTILLLRQPTFIIRWGVLVAQGLFLGWYSLMYMLTPKYCHRFVGYIEEEAVKTYTTLLQSIDAGLLPGFDRVAPEAARAYYQLPSDAKLRDVFACMRADEGHHREVNHTFADMNMFDVNPFPPGF